MVEYETLVSTSLKATISSYHVGCIIEKEIQNLLGGRDRYIKNGLIKESDYRFNGAETVREATEEEIKLYNALVIASNHFKNLR